MFCREPVNLNLIRQGQAGNRPRDLRERLEEQLADLARWRDEIRGLEEELAREREPMFGLEAELARLQARRQDRLQARRRLQAEHEARRQAEARPMRHLMNLDTNLLKVFVVTFLIVVILERWEGDIEQLENMIERAWRRP
ncbi:unnamed protein product [Ectocarpus sp. 12 AP-2014]